MRSSSPRTTRGASSSSRVKAGGLRRVALHGKEVEDEHIYLTAAERVLAREICQLLRDSLIPRSMKLHTQLKLTPRENLDVSRIDSDLIHTKTDLQLLSHLSQEIKAQNMVLYSRLSTPDAVLLLPEGGGDIKHVDVFHAMNLPSSPSSGSPSPRQSLGQQSHNQRRQPWQDVAIDEDFDPYAEEERMHNEQLLAAELERIALMEQASLLPEPPAMPPARRKSSIVIDAKKKEEESTHLQKQQVKFVFDQMLLKKLKALPPHQQPKNLIGSKCKGGAKRRADDKEIHLVLDSGKAARSPITVVVVESSSSTAAPRIVSPSAAKLQERYNLITSSSGSQSHQSSFLKSPQSQEKEKVIRTALEQAYSTISKKSR